MRGSLNHAAPLPCECFILKCAFLEILRRLSNNSFHMQSSIRFTQSCQKKKIKKRKKKNGLKKVEKRRMEKNKEKRKGNHG